MLQGIGPGPCSATREAVMQGMAQYLWVGPLAGNWRSAANWTDLTDGQNPAAVAPGNLDDVTFASPSKVFQSIGGTGSAASIALGGNNAIGGIIVAGSAALTGGTLDIKSGGTLQTSSMTASGAVAVSGSGASLATLATLSVLAGSIAVTGGASLAAGALTIDGLQSSVTVDLASRIEIGAGGDAHAGALTVDPNATLRVVNTSSVYPTAFLGAVVVDGILAASDLDLGNRVFLPGTDPFAPVSSLSGRGTVEIMAAGTVEFGGAVLSGALTIMADAGGSALFDNAVSAGTQIRLAGGNDVVRLSAVTSFGGAISGFDATDVLLLQGAAVTSVSASGGTLTVLDGTAVSGTIQIATAAAGASFQSYDVGDGTTEIVLAPLGSGGGISQGTATPDQYVWIGGLVANWADASDWQDATTAQTPARVAPGSLDLVTINGPGSVFRVIAGSGNAASLTLNGQNLLAGHVVAGSVATSGSLVVGGTLATGSAALGASVTVSGNNAIFTSAGGAVLSAGTLAAGSGGSIVLASLDLSGQATVVQAGAAGSIEIGGAGAASAGTIMVDAGATLTVANANAIYPSALLGPVRIDGLLTAADLDIGNTYFTPGTSSPATVSGHGTIGVVTGGIVEVGGPVLAGGLTFSAGAGAILRLDADVATGNTIALTGNGAAIQLGQAGSFAGILAGFDASDVIVAKGVSLTSAVVSGTTLALFDGGSTVGTIALDRSYAGSIFNVVSTGNLSSEIVLSPPPGAGLSAGTSLPDQFAWAGGISGVWNAAANWRDVTAGSSAASVAPGSANAVSIDSSPALFRVISGIGQAASVAFTGANALTGHISANVVTSTGSLVVAAGGTLASGSLSAADMLVSGRLASLTVAGPVALSGGVLTVGGGGKVAAASLVITGQDSGIATDATGSLVVGNATGAAGLLVGAGATLSATGMSNVLPDYLMGAVRVDGLIAAAELDIGNRYFFAGASPAGAATSVTGTGTIEATAGGTLEFGVDLGVSGLTVQADAGATVRFDGTVDAQVSLVLAGAGVVVQFGAAGSLQPVGFGGSITGFGAGDILAVNAVTLDAGVYSGGTLSLKYGTQVVETLRIAGDFAGATFVVSSPSPGGAQISVVTACFAEGTELATPGGPRKVEALRAGDVVETASGAMREVVWTGRRRLDCRRHARPGEVMPVRIRPHAFGPGRPCRELRLSPDHSVFWDGALIPVRYLVNGASVSQENVRDVTYFHVELASHDVLLAEGLAVESYLDTGNRGAFENGGPALVAHPDFSRRVWAKAACAPLATQGPAARSARETLVERLALLGYEITEDPALRLIAAGRQITAQSDGVWHRGELRDGALRLRIVSRTAEPAWLGSSADHRKLGVGITGLRLDGTDVALDDDRLVHGWYDAEPGLRWTDGDAAVVVSGATLVEVRLAMGLIRYPVPGYRDSAFAHQCALEAGGGRMRADESFHDEDGERPVVDRGDLAAI